MIRTIAHKLRVILEEETPLNAMSMIITRVSSRILGLIFSKKVCECGSNPRLHGCCSVQGGRKITVGNNFIAGYGLRMQAITRHEGFKYTPRVKIGNNVFFNDWIHIACSYAVTIGDGCLFASKVIVTDHNHGKFPDGKSPIARDLPGREVHIGQNVWIGENAVILPGVTIGDGAVVGANSVVNRDVLSNEVYAGVPARKISHK